MDQRIKIDQLGDASIPRRIKLGSLYFINITLLQQEIRMFILNLSVFLERQKMRLRKKGVLLFLRRKMRRALVHRLRGPVHRLLVHDRPALQVEVLVLHRQAEALARRQAADRPVHQVVDRVLAQVVEVLHHQAGVLHPLLVDQVHRLQVDHRVQAQAHEALVLHQVEAPRQAHRLREAHHLQVVDHRALVHLVGPVHHLPALRLIQALQAVDHQVPVHEVRVHHLVEAQAVRLLAGVQVHQVVGPVLAHRVGPAHRLLFQVRVLVHLADRLVQALHHLVQVQALRKVHRQAVGQFRPALHRPAFQVRLQARQVHDRVQALNFPARRLALHRLQAVDRQVRQVRQVQVRQALAQAVLARRQAVAGVHRRVHRVAGPVHQVADRLVHRLLALALEALHRLALRVHHLVEAQAVRLLAGVQVHQVVGPVLAHRVGPAHRLLFQVRVLVHLADRLVQALHHLVQVQALRKVHRQAVGQFRPALHRPAFQVRLQARQVHDRVQALNFPARRLALHRLQAVDRQVRQVRQVQVRQALAQAVLARRQAVAGVHRRVHRVAGPVHQVADRLVHRLLALALEALHRLALRVHHQAEAPLQALLYGQMFQKDQQAGQIGQRVRQIGRIDQSKMLNGKQGIVHLAAHRSRRVHLVAHRLQGQALVHRVRALHEAQAQVADRAPLQVRVVHRQVQVHLAGVHHLQVDHRAHQAARLRLKRRMLCNYQILKPM